jgi:mannose-1-phosphate guanylyltransferase
VREVAEAAVPAGFEELAFFEERGRILGTGGGLKNAERTLRGHGTILVRNSDFLSDIPIDRALEAHRRSGLPATLVLVPERPGYTPLDADASGRVTSIGGEPPAPVGSSSFRGTFTGLHFIEEEILDRLPSGRPSDIVREVYRPLVGEGRLGAWIHRGHWLEFGTPREYLDGSLQLLDLPFSQLRRFAEPDPIREFPNARVAMGAGAEAADPVASLRGRVALGLAARVGSGTRIVDSVVLPEAWIGPEARLERVVVGPGAEIPAGFSIQDALLCADPGDGSAVPPGVERVSGLLVRRFA